MPSAEKNQRFIGSSDEWSLKHKKYMGLAINSFCSSSSSPFANQVKHLGPEKTHYAILQFLCRQKEAGQERETCNSWRPQSHTEAMPLRSVWPWGKGRIIFGIWVPPSSCVIAPGFFFSLCFWVFLSMIFFPPFFPFSNQGRKSAC